VLLILVLVYLALVHATIWFQLTGLEPIAVGLLGLIVLYPWLRLGRYWPIPILLLIVAVGWLCAQQGLGLLPIFVLPLAIYALLAAFFGRSLLPGQTALISRMAIAIRGPQPDFMLKYTRKITLVWTVFFVVCAICSLVLAYVDIRYWSLFTNVIAHLLTGSLFLVEFAWRRWHYPNHSHTDFISFIRDLFKLDWRKV